MGRFFVARTDMDDHHATISGTELEHLRRVLRLKPGDRLTLFDDAGWEYQAILRSFGPDQADVEIVASARCDKESPLELILAIGLTKGEKMDLVIEKATELGVYKVVPYFSSRTVPKLDERKIEKRAERWRRIALGATKQCGRAQIPEILPICAFESLIQNAEPGTLKILCWEREAHQSLPQLRAAWPAAPRLLLAIGPEGGFSAAETELARKHGFESVRLGRRILRAETAAIAATAAVQLLWGDLNRI